MERFYGKSLSQDRVVLLEERKISALSRIDLIENAQKSIDIGYYTIHKGYITDLMLGMIIDAADRGVKVRILLDGVFHNLRGEMKDVLFAFVSHPNIEVRYYETFKPFQPWTWNNRFHDKLLVVDEKYAVIGGRNIGNRYFIEEEKKNPTNDRDVLIINTDLENRDASTLSQFKEYYDMVWNHRFTEEPLSRLSNRQQKIANEKIESLKNDLATLQKKDPKLFGNNIDWLGMSLPTKKVTLTFNPIERMNKEPWVWYDLSRLMERATDSIVIQSPYIIPTKKMTKHLNGIKVPNEQITVLTNSMGSTANVVAFSGHIKHMNTIAEQGVNVFEYQGKDSIHAKTLMFDQQLSVIGAFNVDARSTFLNTETMVIIDSVEFAEHLKTEMNKIINKSLKVAKDGSYEKHPTVKEEEAGFIKSLGIKGLSYVTSLFQHLLSIN